MRKINYGIGLFVLILVLAGCAKPEIRNAKNAGENIICFGDSITFGYGANTGEDYPANLRPLVRLPVVNAGVDGDTTFMALERLDSDVLGKDPRLVIVEFCGNDFLKKVPRQETVKNLSRIIDRIQQRGAMVALVDISSGIFFQEYRKDYKRLAREKKAIFVPSVLNRIITNPAMKSDFFHPNEKGYKLVAARVYKAIAPYIGSK